MAISRREIQKLGVSYGTGAINFGNDSVAFDRELRKLSQNTALQVFLDCLDAARDRMAAEAITEPEATPETETAVEPEATPEPEATTEPEPEETHENPLANVIEKGNVFLVLCGNMALSGLYLQMTDILHALKEECLPSVESIAQLKADYNALIEYVQNH